MIQLIETLVNGVIVGHHPDMPRELVEVIAENFREHIRYNQEHPKQLGDDTHWFWQDYMDVDL